MIPSYRQTKVAVGMFNSDPERLKKLFMDGKLKLHSEVMRVLYFHYLGNQPLLDISTNDRYTENERDIARMFMGK